MESSSSLTLLNYLTLVSNALRAHRELQGQWVTAELSDVQVRGGHCYMELIEKNEVGSTMAKIRATIWSSTYLRVRHKFISETGGELRAGLKVRLNGSVNHHSAYGLSFNVADIDPSYTLGGDLERIRREILQKLQTMGIINENKELKMPMVPQRVAVISAPGAAGYGDFMAQLDNNAEGYVFYTHLFPAVMQGEKTASSVLAALERVETMGKLWDCVVIIRGGGATNDMTGFDNFELAQRVCTFPIPVIVGIGHERDRCVLDEIANVRCKTPTAVAEYLLSTMREAWTTVYNTLTSIVREATLRIEGEKRHLAQLGVSIPSAVRQQLEKENLRLANFTKSIPLAAGAITVREKTRLQSYANSLRPATDNAMMRERRKLESLEKLTCVLSPVNTLKRGYSITRVGGKALRDASQAVPGTEIETQLADGKIISKIQ